MSESKKYYWLKLKKDFFKRHDIRIIEEMENGKDYILFYLKLLCESLDHDGNLRFSDSIPYNDKMLATITNTNVDIVRSAIEVFNQLNMMQVMDDGTYYLNEVQKITGSETEWANKKRKQRLLPKLTNGSTRLNAEMIRLPDGKTRFVDEKRYGGNGMLVLDRSKGKCEICGSSDNLVIHHNNGYSNEPEDLIVLCRECHGKVHSGEIVPPTSTVCPPNVRQEKELEKELELEKEIEYVPTRKPAKHKYGEYQHVQLTDEQLTKLKQELGKSKTEACIKHLDEYIEMKGYKAKNHYLAIKKWVIDAINERRNKTDKAYDMIKEWANE